MGKRSVMISIHPRWCGLIAALMKWLEVRKTIPLLRVPFTVYIYCTRSAALGFWVGAKGGYVAEKPRSVHDICGNGRVIGEFLCDKTYRYTTRSDGLIQKEIDTEKLLQGSCLTWREVVEYESGIGKKFSMDSRKGLWAWQISQLKIYDTPKFLEDFGLKKPPQSWCYTKEAA